MGLLHENTGAMIDICMGLSFGSKMRFLFMRLPQPPTNWRNCMSTLKVIRFNSSCSTRHSYIHIHYHYHYHYHYQLHTYNIYIYIIYIHIYIYIYVCVCVPLQYNSIGPASSEGVLVETTLRTSGALRPTTFAVGTGQMGQGLGQGPGVPR